MSKFGFYPCLAIGQGEAQWGYSGEGSHGGWNASVLLPRLFPPDAHEPLLRLGSFFPPPTGHLHNPTSNGGKLSPYELGDRVATCVVVRCTVLKIIFVIVSLFVCPDTSS